MKGKIVVTLLAIVIVMVALLAIVIVIFAVSNHVYSNFFHAKSVDLSYGDTFPKIDIYNHNGEEIDFLQSKKYKVVFYVKDNCEGCLNGLQALGRVKKIFDSNDLDVIILWEGDIPEKRVKNANVEMEGNYSLKNKIKLFNQTPKGYILNAENKVIFASVTDLYLMLEFMLKKIMDIENRQDYESRACNLILEDFFKRNQSKNDPNKLTLIAFTANYCAKCKNAKKEMKENSGLKNKMNIITVESGDISSDDSLDTDYGNVYYRVFRIGIYPGFIIVGKNREYFKKYDNLYEILNHYVNN